MMLPYTLEEAARINRMALRPDQPLECPRCHGELQGIRNSGRSPDEEIVWLIWCDRCGASLVVSAPVACVPQISRVSRRRASKWNKSPV